jgi:hypothetical protein
MTTDREEGKAPKMSVSPPRGNPAKNAAKRECCHGHPFGQTLTGGSAATAAATDHAGNATDSPKPADAPGAEKRR